MATIKNNYYLSNKNISLWLLTLLLLISLYILFDFSINKGKQAIFFLNSIIASVNQSAMTGSDPAKLLIPNIQIDVHVESMGLAKNGSVNVSENPNTVSWYNRGPRPGEKGSAVISGHYGQWENGRDAVFNDLDKLKKGDHIQVTDVDGKTITFTVQETRIYNRDAIAPEVFHKNNGVYLNLISCYGDWIEREEDYAKRLVVFAKKS